MKLECPECGDNSLHYPYQYGDGSVLEPGWYGGCYTCGMIFYSKMKPKLEEGEFISS